MSEIEFTPDPGNEIVKFEVDRSNMHVEFYDQPRVKPLDVKFAGASVEFRPDNCYVIVYRDAPEYSRICRLGDDGTQQTIFNMPELLGWMSGFNFDRDFMEITKNKKRKSMYDVCGWTADVLLKDRPDPEEKAHYELAQCADLYPLGQLSVEQLVEVWDVEEVDDGDDGA